jgi:hypothetical protein
MTVVPRILLACVAIAIIVTRPATGAENNSSLAGETQARLEYNTELVDALLAQGDPRSMALAATMLPLLGDARSTRYGARSDRLAEAARRAPDDILVQWLGALYSAPGSGLAPAAQALLRLEPENGAVWMFPLQAASKAGDAGGVTEALRHIGAAERFDIHYADFALAWATSLRIHSQPTRQGPAAGFSLEEQPLIQGISLAAALAMPAFQPLVRACKDSEAPLGPERREACIAAGRLMTAHPAEEISRALGASVLRVVGAPGHREATRNFDYLSQMYLAVSEPLETDPRAYQRYEADWREARSETAVIERMLTRAGLPLRPPADWKPAETDEIALRDRPPQA